ncbi:cyclin-like protein [Protomyces lactucae-debilis]|uniref:Cyclin-like protein n=1 Tax=Protomyces lactucae-debilis TaxID=2754530 RepID=A0A1Y2FWA2_PROLT|nr:cyclin-like protein [Protomyces lactucae-debilis]ORY87817.1 cyclin-like protein [Protomyces lactucae-debilis]
MGVKFQQEYKEDIVSYMLELQNTSMSDPNLMDMQPELEWAMRPFLLDFLLEMHAGFGLHPTTLHLAVNIIDRYTSNRVVFKRHYQLLGCTALWIAAKYEEAKDKVPTLLELKAMCCDSYNEKLFLQMEFHVLRTLDWKVGTATTDQFLQVVLTAPQQDDTARTLHLARMLSEITLFHREFLCFRPDAIAQGALCFARQVLDQAFPHYPAYPSGTERVVDELMRKARHLSTILANKYESERYEHVTFRLKHFLEPPRRVRVAQNQLQHLYLQQQQALYGDMCEHDPAQDNADPTNVPSSSPRMQAAGVARARQQPPSKLMVTPIRAGHVYAHGMITPPADDDVRAKQQQQQQALLEEEEDTYATSEPTLSPVSSACSILDSYHQPSQDIPRYRQVSLSQ